LRTPGGSTAWTVVDVAWPSDGIGTGMSTRGVTDRINIMAIGKITAIAITATIIFRTTHCNFGTESTTHLHRQ
jgi:hypothetical protein